MNVWRIEGDDHESRLVEADCESDALDSALSDFREQYGRYSAGVLFVVGQFTGDVDDIDSLEYVNGSGQSKSYALRALEYAQ